MCMLSAFFWGIDAIIQYESELRYESAEYATRKPANRHFNAARPQYPRLKTSQVMASNLLFYESQ